MLLKRFFAQVSFSFNAEWNLTAVVGNKILKQVNTNADHGNKVCEAMELGLQVHLIKASKFSKFAFKK